MSTPVWTLERYDRVTGYPMKRTKKFDDRCRAIDGFESLTPGPGEIITLYEDSSEFQGQIMVSTEDYSWAIWNRMH